MTGDTGRMRTEASGCATSGRLCWNHFYDGQTSLFVNSKKGFGTRITILLPVRKPEEKKRKTKRLHWKKIRWDRQMKVLIVDDDKLARKGLVAIMDWEKFSR